ncbi:MAG: hypothetical protein ACRC7O_07475 [Fimbriiglobus sp.]
MSSSPATNPPKRRPPAGLRCPGCCLGRFETTHTEPLPTGRIRRRKRCRACGTRVVTLEAVVPRTEVARQG